MPEDTITRKEFNLYIETYKKEMLIERAKDSLIQDYGLAAFSGFAAAVCGSATGYQMYSDNPAKVAICAIFTLLNVGFVFYRGEIITNKHKQIKNLEKELKQIKKDPTYLKLSELID